MTSPVADSDCASPVMKKLRLERRVEEELFDPCMVVGRWKERSRVTGEKRNNDSGSAF
ncbi:hypothetical protein PVK06_005824 [Gossypium arboreum]|uniref:Uncharacterized protein n=1 Tax=Gossypium arboreum TaxID=29729 RepID=A0ABR0QVL7_GOSAR|nr:hypothetical protein PVK06_005824 [Gossypium arboreum]